MFMEGREVNGAAYLQLNLKLCIFCG